MDKEYLAPFKGKTIVVTGATGFIGNRLIEILSAQQDCKIVAIVRNFGNAIRLARYPVKIIQADILDKNSCRQAFEGADYLFHCAYGNKGDENVRHQVNYQGTVNLLELAREANVSGFVFLSTVAVYGIQKSGVVTEDTTCAGALDAYGKSKRDAEKIVLSFGQQHQLPVVILQPTGVYGPWSQSYGLKMIKNFQKGLLPLNAQSNGLANLVYVDDVVQAMLKSIVNVAAYGNSYLITGPDCISWEDFFNHFGEMLEKSVYVKMDHKEILAHYKKSTAKPPVLPILTRLVLIDTAQAKKLLQYPFFSALILLLKKMIPPSLYQRSTTHGNPQKVMSNTEAIIPMNEDSMVFYEAESKVSSQKAVRDFEYKPEFPFKEGFARQRLWYNWFSGKI